MPIKGYLITGGIIAFWLVMTALFIRREVLPSLPALAQPSYEAYIKSSHKDQQVKMGVYFRGERIGASETEITTKKNADTKIYNHTAINLPSFMAIMFAANRPAKKTGPDKNLPPGPAPDAAQITFQGQSTVDAKYKLKHFEFQAKSPLMNYNIFGLVEDDRIKVSINDGIKNSVSYLPYDANSTVSDGLSPFVAMPNLTVGKEWAINYINPFGGSLQTLKARVESRTQVEWQGQMHDVYEVTLSQPGGAKSALNYTAYIAPDGRILRQDILMPGLYLLRE